MVLLVNSMTAAKGSAGIRTTHYAAPASADQCRRNARKHGQSTMMCVFPRPAEDQFQPASY
jgi:hypothetical protein